MSHIVVSILHTNNIGHEYNTKLRHTVRYFYILIPFVERAYKLCRKVYTIKVSIWSRGSNGIELCSPL